MDVAALSSSSYLSGLHDVQRPAHALARQAAPSASVQAGRDNPNDLELTAEERQEVQRLKSADQKVRAHEAAHMAAGAGLTQGASFTYTRGPDGRQYVVAGEVTIDTSPGNTPEATIAKAQQIERAALAPADPSPQDRQVAATAAQLEAQARVELQRERAEEQQQDSGQDDSQDSSPALAAYQSASRPEPAYTPTISLFA